MKHIKKLIGKTLSRLLIWASIDRESYFVDYLVEEITGKKYRIIDGEKQNLCE